MLIIKMGHLDSLSSAMKQGIILAWTDRKVNARAKVIQLCAIGNLNRSSLLSAWVIELQ